MLSSTVNIPMQSSQSVLILLDRCESLYRLQIVHAQAISKAIVSLYPSLILNKILYCLTRINDLSSCLHYAHSVFSQILNPSAFSYNNLIRVHSRLNLSLHAVYLFVKMRRGGVSPDSHTFPFVLRACAQLQTRALAQSVHTQSIKFGFISDVFVCNNLIVMYSNLNSMRYARQVFDESFFRDIVTYNSLLDGYVKASKIDIALQLFEEIPERDVVSWSTLLAGYAQSDQPKEAVKLFDLMISSGFKPDNVALVSVLSACAQLGELEKGKSVHDFIKNGNIIPDVFLSTGLVDMYAKCGCIEVARGIFDQSREKNLFTWNAIIMGFAIHGLGELSLEYFLKMQASGIKPDGVSFLGVLVGCSHNGFVGMARQLFRQMEEIYGVSREIKHYGCMADLLGRAGLIEEAVKMIANMPMNGDIYVWGGLLGGCRIHGKLEVAEIAAEYLMEIDPDDGGIFSIMANIYASDKRWGDVAKIRREMNLRRIRKNAGYSSIQVDGITHEFIAGNKSGPQVEEMHCFLYGIL